MTTDSQTTPLRKRKPRPVDPPPPELLLHVLEALLFVADQPVEIAALARTVGLPRAEISGALEELGTLCRERGVRLQRTDNLVQLASAPETASYVELFLGMEHPPLTNASLETLAIIAYRQPVTRPDIEAVRGVDCDGPIRTLMARGLIEEIGRAPVVGRPVLFGTTVRFLEYFGLEKPDDLPPLPLAEGAEAGEDDEEAEM
ncbi:MAG: SMC-Scp complex subunit ScpB [Dehalococcoidia bacterium]